MFKSLHPQVDALLVDLKANRSLIIPPAQGEKFTSLIDAGILKKQDSLITIHYKYPNCLVLANALLEDFLDAIPVKSLHECMELAQKVIINLNKNGITSGTNTFRQHLITETIIYSFVQNIPLSAQILELDRNSPRYFELVNSLAHAIPKLKLPLSDSYQLYAHIYSLTYDDGGSQSIFLCLQEFAAVAGVTLLTLTIQLNNRLPGFVSNILLGLANQNAEIAWAELKTLSNNGYEIETLNAISNMKAESIFEVEKIVEHLKDSYVVTEETAPSLIWAYRSIVNNSFTPEYIRDECVEVIRNFGQIKNERIHFSLLSAINNINLEEERKIEIILTVDFGNINLLHRISHIIGEFSAASFFVIIRKLAVSLKLNFKPDDIHHYLSTNSKLHKETFSTELMAMLTDKNGMIRLGGSRILQVIHSEQTPFNFQGNILLLSEHHQSRMIKSILLDFLHPSDVIKFILPFRFTTHRTVLQTLVDSIAEIFEDYHHDAITFLRKELDANSKVDKELLDIFEKYHLDLATIIMKKNNLEEFNPRRNQARSFYNFMKLSKDDMQEKLRQDQKKDSIFGAVRTVSIARGKSWKIEGNDGGPSPLQNISTQITYPRMCLMNPDQYNWDFLKKVNSDYQNG